MLPEIVINLIVKINVLLVKLINNIIEHETPMFVRVDVTNVSLSMFKWVLQVGIVGFTIVYHLWYEKAYQSFAPVKASFRTKVSFV